MARKQNDASNPPKTLRERAEAMLRKSRDDVADMGTEEIQALVHELQVHQMELEIQNEELRQSQHELAESHDRYADLYDFAPVGYVTFDEDGEILEANLAAASLFGVERQNFLGVKLSRFVIQDSQDTFYLHEQAVFSSEAKQSCELAMHKLDGTQLFVQMESIRFQDPTTHAKRCRTALNDITERKHAELKLSESERRFRRLTTAVTDYIFTVRLENGKATETIHESNCFAVTGYTAEEFTTNPMLWISMVPEDDRAIVNQQVSIILSRQEAPLIEHRIRRKDGQIRWVWNVSVAQYDSVGQLASYDGLIRDITEQKESEGKIQRLNETLEQRVADQTHEVKLLAEAMANLAEGVMITGGNLHWPGPQIKYVNEAMCQMTGYRAEELIGQPPRILQGENSNKAIIKRLRNDLLKKRPHLCEIVNHRKDGTPYNAELFISPMFDTEGNHTDFVTILRDATDRKLKERLLQESVERIRAILNGTADAIVTIDSKGLIVAANSAAELLFGYTLDELINTNVSILMPPPYCDEHDGYITRYLETGEARIIGVGRELVGRRKDGTIFPMELAVAAVDHLGLFTGVIHNISDRKAAEESLRRAHALSESIIDTAQAIIVVLDTGGHILRINSFLEQLTEYTQNEVQGRDWCETFIPAEQRDWIRKLFEDTSNGNSTGENVNSIVTKSGDHRKINWRSTTLKNDDHNVIGIISVGTDITELNLTQEKLLQAGRLSAIGEAMTGLTHESRNALARSQANLRRVSRRL
ncbi:PAS domain-containing protein [Gimesia algae]|uniref:Sensor protein FixL n=1 Tax=Gimesia algae TaxID=2527971 RepID=A0A517VET8_9PLAN|nr:PAS domain S-box protein [Gimesia algae]QDT91524.1 Sensor protein FixL [Gimesia algae]